jgi:hypothetical protein
VRRIERRSGAFGGDTLVHAMRREIDCVLSPSD